MQPVRVNPPASMTSSLPLPSALLHAQSSARSGLSAAASSMSETLRRSSLDGTATTHRTSLSATFSTQPPEIIAAPLVYDSSSSGSSDGAAHRSDTDERVLSARRRTIYVAQSLHSQTSVDLASLPRRARREFLRQRREAYIKQRTLAPAC